MESMVQIKLAFGFRRNYDFSVIEPYYEPQNLISGLYQVIGKSASYESHINVCKARAIEAP
jgi:hypothetical protein